MKHHQLSKRPDSPAKESQASVVKKLEPNSNTVLKRVSSNKSSEIVIKDQVVTLKRRQSRVAETIDVLNPGGPGAENAWAKWFEIDDELKELEEVA